MSRPSSWWIWLTLSGVLLAGCGGGDGGSVGGPQPDDDWVLATGTIAQYDVTALDRSGARKQDAGRTEYQVSVAAVTETAVILHETVVDFDAQDERETTVAYESIWDRNARQNQSLQYADGEPFSHDTAIFSVFWIPTDLVPGQTVMLGQLGFDVAGSTLVPATGSQSATEAWELVFSEGSFQARMLYDKTSGLWLGGELLGELDGTSLGVAYTLAATGRSLTSHKPAPQADFAAVGRSDAGNRQLVLDPAFRNSYSQPGTPVGWGALLTNTATADHNTGEIGFGIHGAAQGLQSLRLSPRAQGAVVEHIWVYCEGLYTFEFRGQADFEYAIAAFDVSTNFIPVALPLLTNRVTFDVEARCRVTGSGTWHEQSVPILHNATLTNFDVSAPPPTASMPADADLHAGGRVTGPVTFTMQAVLQPGLHVVTLEAYVGMSMGRGFISRTQGEIQGTFTAESMTVIWPPGQPPVHKYDGDQSYAERCLELEVSIQAGQYVDGSLLQQAKFVAAVPLHPLAAKGDQTTYEGQEVFDVQDVFFYIDDCDLVITPRPGVIVVRLELEEDQARLWIGTPELPGADITIICEGAPPQTVPLGAFGAFTHNYLDELLGPGIGGWELQPQPWTLDNEWVARHEEVRYSPVYESAFHTDVSVRVRW